MGSGTTTTTTSGKDPWAPATGHLNNVLAGANSLYGTGGPAPYAGPKVAQFNGAQTQGQQQGMLAGNAYAGAADDGTALNSTRSLLQSQMGRATGDPTVNPFARQIIQNQAGDMTDQVNRQFSGSGRLGSYANARAVTDNTGRFLTSAYGDMYDRALNQQNQAVQNSSQLAGQYQGFLGNQGQMRAQAADIYGAVGKQQQDMTQRNYESDRMSYEEAQNRPWDNLNRYSNYVLPVANGGGNTTTTQGSQQSPFQTIAGIGSLGAGLLGLF